MKNCHDDQYYFHFQFYKRKNIYFLVILTIAKLDNSLKQFEPYVNLLVNVVLSFSVITELRSSRRQNWFYHASENGPN